MEQNKRFHANEIRNLIANKSNSKYDKFIDKLFNVIKTSIEKYDFEDNQVVYDLFESECDFITKNIQFQKKISDEFESYGYKIKYIIGDCWNGSSGVFEKFIVQISISW